MATKMTMQYFTDEQWLETVNLLCRLLYNNRNALQVVPCIFTDQFESFFHWTKICSYYGKADAFVDKTLSFHVSRNSFKLQTIQHNTGIVLNTCSQPIKGQNGKLQHKLYRINISNNLVLCFQGFLRKSLYNRFIHFKSSYS